MADLDLAGIITRVCSDLKSKFAAFTHTHATSDIISGVLSIDRLPVGAQANQVAAGNHMHGFLSQTGAINTGVTISSGDSLVIRDSSSSNMIVGTTIGFGTSTTTFLANNGTWQTPAGGGGGANKITLYIASSSGSVIYVDRDMTTELMDYYGYDKAAAYSDLSAADIVAIVYPLNGGITRVAVCIDYDNVEDELKIVTILKNGNSKIYSY